MTTKGKRHPWSVERRLEFIEFRLFWEGGVNRADLIDAFGISVPQASKDLSLYQERAPGNVVYDKSAKRYEHLTYDEVIERKLNVMDTAAIALCRDHGMPMRIYDMTREGDLMRIMKGQAIGTLVDRGR